MGVHVWQSSGTRPSSTAYLERRGGGGGAEEREEMEEGREKKSIEKGRGENRLEGKEREIIKR